MQIGSKSIDPKKFSRTRLSDLTPEEYAGAREAMKHGVYWNADWKEQDATRKLTFPGLGVESENAVPTKTIPPELFNFDLILSGHTFRVMCDKLLQINELEDLGQSSALQLANILQSCSAYRMTCYMAFIAAHKEHRRIKQMFEMIAVKFREEARQAIRAARIADKHYGVRKEIGQISAQEVEDYVMRCYPEEYKKWQDLVAEWEDNENIYLELRDVLKDRGMHLQTLLRMSTDPVGKSVSSGTQW